MIEPLRFQQVRTQEQFDEVKDFAEGFQHIIDEKTALPIVTVGRKNKGMFGYYHVLQHPVISFAFHTSPEICSPRDFKDMVEAVKYHSFQGSMSQQFPNGACFAALPNHPIISSGVIEKMGFKNREMTIWQATG